MEVLGDQLRNYSHLTYISTERSDSEHQEEEAMEMAEERGWTYSEVEGSTRLILKLMNGQWDESEFLTVEPGKTIDASHDDEIIMLI
jgi:hypothetical protein